jgi:hypothetical protein
MPRKSKINNPVVLYEIFSSYGSLPQSTEGQRELVGMIYDYVKGKGGSVRTEDAKDGRIYYVARRILNKAQDTYYGLTRKEQYILDSLLRIHRSAGDERDDRIERLCIQIENVHDSDITERVEDVAVQVLRRGLRIGSEPGSQGVLF